MHRDLVKCCICTERELEEQEKLRTQQLNEISHLSAHICELTDHVAKARLRETELTERVARWVEYLREEKQKMLKRGNSLYATGTLSATVSDDIEYNISMLMKMRERVDKKLLEIKQRRKEHKYQLKEMKNEMLLMHHQLVEWDKKYDEISDITKRMNVSRKQLQDRIKEQQQKETAAKLACVELDKKLHDLYSDLQFPGNEEESKIDLSSGLEDSDSLRYHFSVTRSTSFQEIPSMGDVLKMSKGIKL
ncbi:hypothetical protein V3C99_013985 [Haemonchus contortus]